MAKTAPDSPWIPSAPHEVKVGDVIRYSIKVRRMGDDGRVIMYQGPRGAFPLQTRHNVIARVVDTVREEGEERHVVERVSIDPPGHGDEILEPVVHSLKPKLLADPKVDLQRHRSDGPTYRSNKAGRLYLLALLHRAAGGDHEVDAAVARVAACVSPQELALDPDRPLRQLGWTAAQSMLMGQNKFSEVVLCQLNSDPRKRPVIRRSIPGDAKPIVDAVYDTEVAAILKQFPGAKVIDVRLRREETAAAIVD